MGNTINTADNFDFDTFIEGNKGIIFKVANSYCRDAEDRKDLVQEIIIQLWRSFSSFNHSVKRSTWTYRVALNVAISFYRKDVTRKKLTTELSGSLVDIIAEHEPPEKEEQFHQLQTFIAELKEMDRALMILYLEDKNQKEIGEILGISETNVSTKIARIKDKLRRKFLLTDQ
ncbi:sigma-70 family RNA polymerase sigma factor [Marivirga sp. S37H4]|uniref:Sigma-70 family RNA polymerase sigma factor n=1 Tax=Marivirga aurantiaca TaxID=2802615 RepID=A0A934WVR9_9BACT|nr:sigma-70 family RNA polymerase sigma factor [Marivirga aurantiaca]MBK6263948.1 sigma-70 family RNA polymerase sigma factor [Marivirga aurantiaca]